MSLCSPGGLLSKLAAFACLGALLSGPAEAAMVARGGRAAMPVAVAPRTPPRAIVRAGSVGHRFAGRRFGRGDGYAGLGVAALGLGEAGYGLDAGDGLDGGFGGPPPIGGYGPPPMLPPPVVLPPLPPACPLIIKVGRGLTHAVKTQILYGRPVCRP